jgi:hypothetical protein
VYAKLSAGGHRLFGATVAIVLSGLAVTFGWGQLAYAAALFGLGVLLLKRRSREMA